MGGVQSECPLCYYSNYSTIYSTYHPHYSTIREPLLITICTFKFNIRFWFK